MKAKHSNVMVRTRWVWGAYILCLVDDLFVLFGVVGAEHNVLGTEIGLWRRKLLVGTENDLLALEMNLSRRK